MYYFCMLYEFMIVALVIHRTAKSRKDVHVKEHFEQDFADISIYS